MNYEYFKLIDNKEFISGDLIKTSNQKEILITNGLSIIRDLSIHLGLISMLVIKTDLYKMVFNKISNFSQKVNKKSNLVPLLISIYCLSNNYKGIFIMEKVLRVCHQGEITFPNKYGPLSAFLMNYYCGVNILNLFMKEDDLYKIINYLKLVFKEVFYFFIYHDNFL